MTDKEVRIDDMQKTTERLQKECTEKTDNIIALSEQLQRKEQECEELKEKLIKRTGEVEDILSIVEDMAILLKLDKKDHFKITECYYKVKANKQTLDKIEQYCRKCNEIAFGAANSKKILSIINEVKDEN